MKPMQDAAPMAGPLLQNITPSGCALGAEVTGIDLAAGLDEKMMTAIRDAVLRYSVLVVRGQKLTPADHLAFTSRIGEVYGQKQISAS